MHTLARLDRVHLQLALGNRATVARIGARHVNERLNHDREAKDYESADGVSRCGPHPSLSLGSAPTHLGRAQRSLDCRISAERASHVIVLG